jgi:hypothetical protein
MRDKKPSAKTEGSHGGARSAVEAARGCGGRGSMEFQSISAWKSLPEAGIGKNVVIDGHRCCRLSSSGRYSGRALRLC